MEWPKTHWTFDLKIRALLYQTKKWTKTNLFRNHTGITISLGKVKRWLMTSGMCTRECLIRILGKITSRTVLEMIVSQLLNSTTNRKQPMLGFSNSTESEYSRSTAPVLSHDWPALSQSLHSYSIRHIRTDNKPIEYEQCSRTNDIHHQGISM